MAYDKENKKLYITVDSEGKKIGITPNEIGLCIQDYRVDKLGNADLSIFCTPNSAGQIMFNKWNIHKPVPFPKWTKLTEAEFKGRSTDASQGIYYAIQFPASMSGVLNASIFDIHDAEFTYIPPKGGASEPFRIDDLDGYDHNAEPNPVARFNKEADGSLVGYRDDYGNENGRGGLMDISVIYSKSNEAGIDLVSIYASLADITVTDDMLEKTYPCILISDANNTFNYFTALSYLFDNGSIGSRPLLYNGTPASANRWSVKFTKILKSNNAIGSRPPFESDLKGLRASIFLLQSSNASAPTLGLDNFGENWIDISDGYAATSKAIVVPGDNGLTLNLREHRLYAYYIASGLSQVDSTFNVPFSFYNPTNGTEELGKVASVKVTLTDNATGESSVKNPQTVTIPVTPSVAMFSFDDFGIVRIPGAVQNMKVTVETTVDGLPTYTWTKDYQITLI